MKKYSKVILVALALFFGSCDSLLEIEPRQSVDSSNALKTPEGITSNVANIYGYLKNVLLYGRDFVATSEALADNARIINRAGGRYQNQGSNAPFSHFGNWALAYAGINEINLVLKALPTANVTDAFRSSVEGEVKALRALFYFDLMRAYSYEPNMAPSVEVNKGAVPLELSGVLSEEQIVLKARATQADVYAQIYADLTDATAKAPDSGGPYFMTKAAAHALFAKVALYNRDWVKAEQEATAALAIKGTLTSNANYVAAWRTATHEESIFEVLFKNASESIGVNESVQSAFSTRVALNSTTLAGWGAVVPTASYLALFPAGDVRRNLYELGLTRSSSTVIECTKFMGKTGTIYMDNIPVIRVSEVYLIRAEARAQQGTKDAEAEDDLNLIETRAGITASSGLTGTALLDAIYLQRRLELGFEGDRWFDVKRRGEGFVKSTGNVPYDDYRVLAPLPVREIQSNILLVQNPNY